MARRDPMTVAVETEKNQQLSNLLRLRKQIANARLNEEDRRTFDDCCRHFEDFVIHVGSGGSEIELDSEVIKALDASYEPKPI